MPTPPLKPEERNLRVSALLRQVDEDVKAKNLDQALDRIRKVYEYDIKNIYARAYEERILVMMLEKEREAIVRETQQKLDERVDQEVKRRLKDFYRQQELEAQKRKEEEQKEEALASRARKASVDEAQEVTHKDMAAIEREAAHRVDELEKKLIARIQQVISTGPASSSTAAAEQARIAYEQKLQQYKKQAEEAEEERKKIQEEAFLKMKEEQKRSQSELVRRMEEERDALVDREKDKAKQKEIESYRTVMKLMMQLAVPAETQSSILQSLKISFSISDAEHMDIERTVQVSAYIDAVRTLWRGDAKPAEEDLAHLKNLQAFFRISDDEHTSILRGVKAELGLPEVPSAIVVIDDDPSIRKYAEHLLKKSRREVITAANAESIVADLQKSPPDLIICDVNLGAGMMSGFTFYEKIAAGAFGEQLRSVPYVLMSSLVDEFFVKTAKQLGVKVYMPKPFTREKLEAAITTALG
jgi:CheY-like chemotaxis protein